jgi:hypothetical protein
MLLLLTACELPFAMVTSEAGFFAMAPDKVFAAAPKPPQHGTALLSGTRLCPDFNPTVEESLTCHSAALTGQVYDDQGCITMAPGFAEWTWTSSCELPSDRLRYEVIDLDGAAVRFDPLFETWIREDSEFIQAVGAFPEPGPFRAVEGYVPWGLPVVEHPEHGIVGFSITTEYTPTLSEGTLTMTASGKNLTVPMPSAKPTDVVRLELYGVYLSLLEPVQVPIGARAVAYDAEGNRLLGVPVTWSSTGTTLCLGPIEADEGPGPDPMTRVGQSDCETTEVGAATLTAEANGLTASVDFAWDLTGMGDDLPMPAEAAMEPVPKADAAPTPEPEPEPEPEPKRKKRRRNQR